jgi:hypothetical protein
LAESASRAVEAKSMGFNLDTYTLVHVVLSLIGIGSGLLVVIGLLAGKPLNGLTTLFLTTTVATSVTGYGFPVTHLLPSHVVGAISLVALAFAIYARYSRKLAARWRTTYVVCAVAALYLNVFVLVVQLFLKVPSLHALAPTQSEPPFGIAQVIVLAIFIVLGTLAVRRSKSA